VNYCSSQWHSSEELVVFKHHLKIVHVYRKEPKLAYFWVSTTLSHAFTYKNISCSITTIKTEEDKNNQKVIS